MKHLLPNCIYNILPPFPNAAYDVVALVASAGGLNALSQILADLPADFPATLVVVQHLSPQYRSRMADLLRRHTQLWVKQAEQGEPLKPSTVYIAPPNYHLLVNSEGTLALSQTERVHFVRPSADLLLDSVAASYRDRAIAVVLTGSGRDGASGIRAIKARGGVTIVQAEASAEFSGMPSAAIQTGAVDLILSLPDIAEALVSLVMGTTHHDFKR